MRLILLILLFLFAALLLTPAFKDTEATAQIGFTQLTYQYDSVHEVGIYIFQGTGGNAIAVVPKVYLANPDKPMKE